MYESRPFGGRRGKVRGYGAVGAKLIILSADASDNTKKKFSNMAEFRSVPIIFVGDRDEIGHSIGRRFAVSCCVTDDGFAKRLKSLAEDM